MILAADRNWAIGNKGGLLCHLPGDLKFFKDTTMGHTIIMGRLTLLSMPGKKGLPGRRNIVLTRNPDFTAEGVETVSSVEEALAVADDDAFVIGGGDIYKQFRQYCDTCYVTKIDAKFPADTWFENLDEDPGFLLAEQGETKEENGIKYRFCRYERKSEQDTEK